jgi:4-diphosphocytidyl-2C-methyl-D-erythritol kinase
MDRLKTILTRYPDGARVFYNRLEDAICPAYPVVNEIVTRLLRSGASAAHMSGSGSGVFGAFKTAGGAADARRKIGRTDWRMPIVESRRGGVELFK